MCILGWYQDRLQFSDCESCSVVSNSLQPRGLYSPWDSLGLLFYRIVGNTAGKKFWAYKLGAYLGIAGEAVLS